LSLIILQSICTGVRYCKKVVFNIDYGCKQNGPRPIFLNNFGV
jgi:hypothetical protein